MDKIKLLVYNIFMAIIDIKKIKSAKELETIARRDLEGKTLAEIADWINQSDTTSRVTSKGNVGYVIEKGYFGIEMNSDKSPDIPSLGVEVKTSPLTLGKDGKLRVKEPLSLNMINYSEEVKNKDITESSLLKKNHKVLFIWYIHNPDINRSEYIIKYVFIWEMNDKVIAEINPDYEKIIKKIKEGIAHQIHQSDHDCLTLCPKHNGKFSDPDEKTSKTKQPFSDIPAERRAFRLKNSYMNKVIRKYLAKERPTEVNQFIGE
jgi:DNA mismatch repair protein MutH